MGTVSQLLFYYGHGEAIFGEALGQAELGLKAGETSRLCRIMTERGTDKGIGRHNYTFLYDTLFTRLLPNARHVFELGIGTTNPDMPANMGPAGQPGASLRGWHDYFRGKALIAGADIDMESLFQEPGIQTLYVDATDSASVSCLWEHLGIDQDLIIDDGLHEFGANKTFLYGSKGKLKRDGLYIIEDIVMSSDIARRYDLMLNDCGMNGFLYRLPHPTNTYDNAVAVLCGPDWRAPAERPDTAS